ncbi:Uncharacterised protein [uncultured archaeon]|nr:Uncharacterised protein [uncultured archaeon]
MNIGEIFVETASDGAIWQAQHPVRYGRDIGADMLCLRIDLVAPDDIG